MKRKLCLLALLGVALLPDWASAFYPCWAPPPPCVPFGFGYQSVPVYPQPPVYVVPGYEVPLIPPQVRAVPPAAAASPRLTVPSITEDRVPAPKASVPPPPVTPETTVPPTPAAKKPDPEPMFKPAGGPSPLPPPIFPPEVSRPGLPPLDLPAEKADPKPTAPMPAAPAVAPAPASGDTRPVIPLPGLPDTKTDTKKPKASDDPLPPLVLPPEGPGAPSGIVPPINSTSKSSPLTAESKVEVFTTGGTPAVGPTRRIGFFNHTDKDIGLVIEGRATTLPRKTYIHAEVPPTFRWKYADAATRTATVPAGAAGLDVLFRE